MQVPYFIYSVINTCRFCHIDQRVSYQVIPGCNAFVKSERTTIFTFFAGKMHISNIIQIIVIYELWRAMNHLIDGLVQDCNILPGQLSQWKSPVPGTYAGLTLGFRPINKRRRYKVTPSPIGWAQT